MKKKAIIFLSILIMICTMFQPVLAEDNVSFANWSVTYEGQNANAMSRDRNVASPSETYYFNSSYALSVKCPDYVGDGYLVVKNTLQNELNPGNYTLEFYIRGNFSDEYEDTAVGFGSAAEIYLSDDGWDIETGIEGADGRKWKKYQLNFNITESADTFYFKFAGYTNGCNIDCVSIKDGSETEYIQNGDFEDFSENVASEYDEESYSPVNLITTPISGGLAVSWKNPSTSNLKSMSLYDITNGEVLLSDTFSNVPSESNRYKVVGLENGSVYHYKLRITYLDGNIFEYFVYGIPKANDTQLSPWGVTLSRDSADGYTAGEFTIDTSEKADGEVSLKYVSNSPGGSNRFALLTQSATVEVGADYRLSFKAKAKNSDVELQVKNGWNNLDGNSNPTVSGFKGTYDWKDFSVEIRGASSKSIKFYFILEGLSEGVWFDSVSLYKLEDGNLTGDNLMRTAGFEELYSPSELGTVSGISTSGGDEKIDISWNTSSGATKIKLFRNIEGNYDPIGYVHPSYLNLTVNSLQNDTPYSFALACADDYGNIGEMAIATGTTIAPDFKVYSPILYEGRNEASGFSFGDYTIKTNVRNNKIEKAVPVTQMVALYKGDILKKIVSTSINANKLMQGKPSTTISTTINIPENPDGDYSLNVFIWDSKNGMKSMYDYVTFEQTKLQD